MNPLSFLRPSYYKVRQSYPIWFNLINRSAKKCHETNHQELDLLGQRIIKDLRNTGIAVANLEELFPGKNWLEKLRSFVELKRPVAQAQKSKPFLLQLWDNKSLSLDFSNPFLSLALKEKIITIANEYLKMCSRFYFFEGSITLPVDANAPQASQRWHHDPEDPTMCKVFFYLNDVDATRGPFHYVLGSHIYGKHSKLFPQQWPGGCYPPAGELEKAILPNDIKVCTGKAGTVIFCDTAGLHRGGYATAGERWMMTAGYSSPKSLWPARYQQSANFDQQDLGKLARVALRNH